MKHETKNVFIAGGTGFLGYYSALLFLEKGCKVSTIALPNEIDLGDWFPKQIDLRSADLFLLNEDEIYSMLKDKDYDTFVYALGPDDRVTPKAPAYNFFHLRLVEHCLKICGAAKRAGIKRCVVLNSYFAYFDRLQNGALSKRHPYVRCRNEQAEAIINLGEKGVFDVMFLELPYIFGAMPARMPIWKTVFIDRFAKLPAFYFPDGGTAAVHVTGVAEAVVAAAFNGQHGEKYTVGSVNMKYRDMIGFMLASAGIKKKFVKIPQVASFLFGNVMYVLERFKGLQGGLDLRCVMTQILSKDFYFDPKETHIKLGYHELGFTGGENCWKGIQEAMKKCFPDSYTELPWPEIKAD